MSDKSLIEWTDATWNPIRARSRATGKVGWFCVHASEGCRNCYAETFNIRLGNGAAYKAQAEADVEIFLDERTLTQPPRWRRPRKIFVGSMTDLFADFVTDAWLDRIFAVMALAPQHTFQVLTKRPDRMRAYFAALALTAAQAGERSDICPRRIDDAVAALARTHGDGLDDVAWPLTNVWLGASAEDHPNLLMRLRELLLTPAAIRFLSMEPLIGPADLMAAGMKLNGILDVVTGERRFLDWVIVGGESGRGARPMHPDWARKIRDDCAAAGVAFFFKQWGEWAPVGPPTVIEAGGAGVEIAWPDGVVGPGRMEDRGGEGQGLWNVGKKAAGRELDGVTHDAFPWALSS